MSFDRIVKDRLCNYVIEPIANIISSYTLGILGEILLKFNDKRETDQFESSK